MTLHNNSPLMSMKTLYYTMKKVFLSILFVLLTFTIGFNIKAEEILFQSHTTNGSYYDTLGNSTVNRNSIVQYYTNNATTTNLSRFELDIYRSGTFSPDYTLYVSLCKAVSMSGDPEYYSCSTNNTIATTTITINSISTSRSYQSISFPTNTIATSTGFYIVLTDKTRTPQSGKYIRMYYQSTKAQNLYRQYGWSGGSSDNIIHYKLYTNVSAPPPPPPSLPPQQFTDLPPAVQSITYSTALLLFSFMLLIIL